jgi:hypothetical protein
MDECPLGVKGRVYPCNGKGFRVMEFSLADFLLTRIDFNTIEQKQAFV